MPIRTRSRYPGLPPVALALLLFSAPANAQEGPPSTPVEAGHTVSGEIGPGEGRRFEIALEAGERVRGSLLQRGINLALIIVGPDGAPVAIIDGPHGANGPEPFDFEAPATGSYFFDVSSLDENAPRGQFDFRIDRKLTREEVAAEKAAADAREAAVRDWIAGHLRPLAGVEPGGDSADLEPLRAAVGDAAIVALGEATSGAHEFQRMKHRLFEYLVAKMGFTALAMGVPLAEAYDVDRWIQGGEGDGARALAALYGWNSDTREVMELLTWMRAWNLEAKHARKLHFYGIDVQPSARAVGQALAALAEVDAAQAAALTPRLARLSSGLDDPSPQRLPAAEREALAAAASELGSALAARRSEVAAKRGAEETERASRAAKIVVTRLAMQGAADRSRAFADNLRWALAREGEGGKIVLWSHNSSIRKDGGPRPPLGSVLAGDPGATYRAIGFAFSEGDFQARGAQPPMDLATFHVDAAPAGSFDAMLAASGRDFGFLDLAALPAEGAVRDWFGAPQTSRSIGAVFGPPVEAPAPVPLREAYDAIVFVRRTTATRPMPSGVRRSPLPLAAPANLDFEEGAETAASWQESTLGPPLGYRLALDERGPAHGRRSLCVHGDDAGRYGVGAGGADQAIEVAAWAGRRVQLTGAIRAEGGIEAEIALRIEAAQTLARSTPAAASDASGWRRVAVEATVPPDASVLFLSLAASGRGTACFDDLALAPVDPAPVPGS